MEQQTATKAIYAVIAAPGHGDRNNRLQVFSRHATREAAYGAMKRAGRGCMAIVMHEDAEFIWRDSLNLYEKIV